MIRPLYIFPILLLLGLTGAVQVVRAHRAAPPVTGWEAQPTNPRAAWAMALLEELGNAQPSGGMVQEVVNWSLSEDRSSAALARNNPWNTTMCGFGQMDAINGDGACGVGAYPTMADGVGATVATLEQGNFADVRASLLANDPEGFKAALWSSPWAASHYEYGAGWVEETQVQSAPRVSSKCLPTSTGLISAHFSDTSSPYWGAQYLGMHNGTDYAGSQGDPVYAPFDLTVEDIQYYSDPARIGWYVQGRMADGYLYYSGHLGTVEVVVGQFVGACSVIGTIGDVFHTHVKVASPGKPVPCEATGCDNFELYFEEH